MENTTTINDQFQSLVNGTTHNTHGVAGTNNSTRNSFWEEFRSIYADTVKIEIRGNIFVLKANHSVSKKSTAYYSFLSKQEYTSLIGSDFGWSDNPKNRAHISIQNGQVQVRNGKNFYETIENKSVTIL